MPWVTPSSVSTGDTLQASEWNQSVVLNSLMGQPVFTNEAARDAAISSPSEGQTCYLTNPTIPAATGGATSLPTGITTVYNGTAWVAMGCVSAYTSNSGTTTSATFTATLSGSPGTNPSVTLATGDRALISIQASMKASVADREVYMGVAVSGATTSAAALDSAIIYVQPTTITNLSQVGTTLLIGSLTPGTNTFTLNYGVSGDTATFGRRRLIVQGIA